LLAARLAALTGFIAAHHDRLAGVAQQRIEDLHQAIRQGYQLLLVE
jgi:hypothetical protein